MFLATTLGSPFGWSSSFALPYLSCFLWPLRPGPGPLFSGLSHLGHGFVPHMMNWARLALTLRKFLAQWRVWVEAVWGQRADGGELEGEAVGQTSGPGLVDLQSTYQEGAVWCPVFGKPGYHNWRFFWRRKAQIKAISWERQNCYLQCQGDIYSKKLRGPLKNFDVGTISLGARSTIQAIKDEMEKW